MKQAVIYCRQSSGSEKESLSIEVQEQNCRKLCKDAGIEVLAVFHDYNTSGEIYPAGKEAEKEAESDKKYQAWRKEQKARKKDFRIGLGKALELLPKVDFFVVNEITRLYRPVGRLEAFINDLFEEHNVVIKQVQGGDVDFTDTNHTIINYIQNKILFKDVQKKRQNSLNSLKAKREKGELCSCKAFGAIYSTSDKSITFDAEKAGIVAYVFESIAKHIPYNQITFHVNENYKHLFDGKNGNGKCFYQSNLYNISRNMIYSGYVETATEEELEAGISRPVRSSQVAEPIITYALFAKVQKIMKRNRENSGKAKLNVAGEQKNWLPLSGYFYCANCGAKLVSGIDKGSVFYYCKTGMLKKDKNCTGSRIVTEFAEDHKFFGNFTVMKYVESLLPIALIKRFEELKAEASTKIDIDALKLKITNLENACKEAFQSRKEGLISSEIFKSMVSGAGFEIKELEEQLRIAESDSFDSIESEKREITDYLTKIHYSNYDLKQDKNVFADLLQRTIEKMVVSADSIQFFTIYGSFEVKRTLYKRVRMLDAIYTYLSNPDYSDKMEITIKLGYSDSEDDKETEIYNLGGKVKIVKVGN